MTTLCSLSILAARFDFIRGHCGKVASKALPGRETGASAQAAILSQYRAASMLSIFKIRTATGLFYSAGIRLYQTTSRVPGDGRCCAVLIFNHPQVCPAYFKGGVTTLEERPCSGMLDCAGLSPYREYPRCL